MLAACSEGGGSQVAPVAGSGNPSTQPRVSRADRLQGVNHRPNWISPTARSLAKKHSLLFVADNFNNLIDIFPQDKPARPIGTITNGVASPSGLGVDSSGNLYVTSLSTNSVTVHAPPYTAAPATTYTSGLFAPVAIAIGTDGSVYVSDYDVGTLVEYPPHSTAPSNLISLPGRPNGVALDASNNLFVAYEPYVGTPGVLEFAPGSTTGTDLGIKLGFAGALTFDSRGNLLVVDEIAGAETVNVYPPGSKTPSQRINNGFLNPISIAFNARQKLLYVADSGALDVESITYPAAQTVTTITGFGGPLGVALSPAAPK